MKARIALSALALAAASLAQGLQPDAGLARFVEAGPGYSKTSVNTAVFRSASLATHDSTQYIAYYDSLGYLTLGKRPLGAESWELSTSQYRGNVSDAHNVISIGVDGNGVLHTSFDHHGHPLRYARAVAPGSLQLGPLESMTGIDEEKVTYPEFYTLADGDMLFVYRSGASGRGNMAINRYDHKSRKWLRVQDNLLDGQDERSPYWQLCVDANGVIHLSWVWRETWLVETNHDLCYARSSDGGRSWQKSDGSAYTLPINAANAEYAWRIPQNSELINQTAMTADADSRPYIVTYWRDPDSSVPQYRMVWHDGTAWKQRAISQRTTPFSLAGGGTKMIPVSRPRVVADGNYIAMIFRDAERGSKVSMSSTTDGPEGTWSVSDLTLDSVDAWEPTLDCDLWRSQGKLHIFVQRTAQGDGERTVDTPATAVGVLEVK
ncbi:MAG: BNR repeat-containing protein [Muribaculaceae bacterium]|nr:BNR repeat-containing protein [Muribaculaceae bacterium]